MEANADQTQLNPKEQRLWYSITDLSESEDQINGTIEKNTKFRSSSNTVIQGPHIFVANPYYKTPRTVCETHASYDWIDLTNIPCDYTPRSNFGVLDSDSRLNLSRCRWDKSIRHCDTYRVAVREMVNLTSERSLISAIIPIGFSHINTVRSVAFSNLRDLLNFQALTSSVVLDGMYKMSSRDHFGDSDAGRMPWVQLPDFAIFLILRLSCLTDDYAQLWNKVAPNIDLGPFGSDFQDEEPSPTELAKLPWNWNSPLRQEAKRRQALVQLDVLVAQEFGLSINQLVELYETYFSGQSKKRD